MAAQQSLPPQSAAQQPLPPQSAAQQPLPTHSAAQPLFDPRVWPGFERFNQVQGILDQNRLLIHEIKANHEARLPDGLMRNVTLIRQLNSNVTKVVDLYAEISQTFVRSFGNPNFPHPSASGAVPEAAAGGAEGADIDG
ncbi:hypothetical protein CLOM_g12604 [Closterium sp. NIES-68]|nr:hypothetical protein CLOM_g12604 [Closterium sp. NIES-68]GJP79463.1 hypothetical protein CLOP_g9695 [Closterium sp. NIES-67]